MSMSTYVQVSDDDQAEHLVTLMVRLTQTSSKDGEAWSKLVRGKKYAELLDTCVLPNMAVLATAPADEFDAALAIAFSLFTHLSLEQCETVIPKFAAALCGDGAHVAVHLRQLTFLFNYLPATAACLPVLLIDTLKYAQRTKQAHLLPVSPAAADKWVTESWDCSPSQAAQVYAACAEQYVITGDVADTVVAARKTFTLKHLKALDDCDEATRTASAAYASEAARHAITDPTSAGCDALLQLKAIQALKTSSVSEHRQMYELLYIFGRDSVDKYLTWSKVPENTAFVKAQGFDEPALVASVRALTLCNMGLDADKTIALSYIQEQLSLDSVEAAEEAVIIAVASGRIDAKIDEVNGTVTLARGTHRFFTTDTWRTLDDKLKEWRNNIGKTLEALDGVHAN